jgi:uncharacterized cofD-like protein
MSPPVPSEAHPGSLRVVAIGGGTGLPGVLRGLRELVDSSTPSNLTAIVTMSDDGGSSGRLRRGRGLPPPGDVRNCLVALSPVEDLLAGLFQHRYDGGHELNGHNLGNLILVALAEQTGSFLKAVEVSSRVLRTVGRILPVTLDDVRLEATTRSGREVLGESAINACGEAIREVRLSPPDASPSPGVVEAIRQADLVALGPGSLYTSLLPNLALPEVARALRETSAVRVLVGNLVTEPGEPADLGLAGHVRVLREHAGGDVVDAILVHDGAVPDDVRDRYREEGAVPLAPPRDADVTVRVFRRALVAGGPKLRHESLATAQGLLAAWQSVRTAKMMEAPLRARGDTA